MLFNSILYLFFLSIVVTAYYILPDRFRWIWLLTASVGYYVSFIPVFIFLMLTLALLNFYMAKHLSALQEGNRSVYMIIIVIVNVMILCLFKYFNIIFPGNQIHLHTTNILTGYNQIDKMILPLGLSYLVFTVLSYHIEIKRNNIQAERHLGYFSLYLFFFPKIAQGPIEKPQQLIPRLHDKIVFERDALSEGLKLMLLGYFKKLVVADRLAIYVNAVYGNSDQHNGTSLLTATIFLAFQVYADFSGYTDIALGSARLFGFNLTNNFNRPYFSTSIKEFWTRWHISLSTWLRDYIFLPLAYFLTDYLKKEKYLGLSKEKWIYMLAITVTFSICGIWHGVGWTFLIWGLLFGFYQTYANWTADLNKQLRKFLHIKKKSKWFSAYNVIMTFMLILTTWIFFRADSVGNAINILATIFKTHGPLFIGNSSSFVFGIAGILALILIDFKNEYFNGEFSVLHNRYLAVRVAGIVCIVLTILLIGVLDGGQFIYFQF
jgi:alginate O-acetyltransferase complex protein AlgI